MSLRLALWLFRPVASFSNRQGISSQRQYTRISLFLLIMLASSRGTKDAGSYFGGTRIEVTIQSLEGVRLNRQFSNGQQQEEDEVKASVAFTGSATNMEVGSSSVCASTGQLLVESSPLTVSETVDKEKSPLLTIEWPGFHMPGQAKPLPHLAVQVPYRDPTLPKLPLSKSNRGSRIVKEIPILDELATNSTASCSTKSDGSMPLVEPEEPELSSSPSRLHKPEPLVRMRSGSVIWSNSGAAAMPEIVELTVRVQKGCRLCCEGMAYLVLFAHEDDYGTCWMDLPIQPLGGKKHESSSDLSFSPAAHLRVKIKVFPETKQPDLTAATVSSSMSSSSSTEIISNIKYSKSLLEAQFAPLLEKIRENQELAEKFLEAQRNAMEIHVPGDNEAPAGASGCRMKWSWRKVVRTLKHAMSCHGGSPSGAIGIPGSSISVGSSIVTSDSMDL